jgi:hypothetical protein
MDRDEKMKLRHLTTGAMALILISACGDATGVTAEDLAGTWTSTAAVFTSVEDPTMTADIADEGNSVTMVLGADGTFTATYSSPGETDDVDTGTYTVVGDVLTISDSGEGTGDTFTIARDGDSMTLTSDDEYDFGTGVEPAILVITLSR